MPSFLRNFHQNGHSTTPTVDCLLQNKEKYSLIYRDDNIIRYPSSTKSHWNYQTPFPYSEQPVRRLNAVNSLPVPKPKTVSYNIV